MLDEIRERVERRERLYYILSNESLPPMPPGRTAILGAICTREEQEFAREAGSFEVSGHEFFAAIIDAGRVVITIGRGKFTDHEWTYTHAATVKDDTGAEVMALDGGDHMAFLGEHWISYEQGCIGCATRNLYRPSAGLQKPLCDECAGDSQATVAAMLGKLNTVLDEGLDLLRQARAEAPKSKLSAMAQKQNGDFDIPDGVPVMQPRKGGGH